MIFEVEDETRDFVTIYKKDYPSKSTERQRECRPQPKYTPPLNILNAPYKKVLNTGLQNSLLPLEEQSENPVDALKKIRDEYPRLNKFLPEAVPDEHLIEQTEKKNTQTVYQLDYSKGEYKTRLKIFGRRKDITLPPDWIISETIQKQAYRNPWKIVSRNVLQAKRASRPPGNLNPSQKQREILRVRTGDTEYNVTIDAIGNKILEEHLLGAPLPLEPKIYTKGPDSPTSECSRVLKEKKVVIPSNVI